MEMTYDNTKGGNFKSAPAGLHNARVVSIIDIGTQLEKGFNNGPDKNVRRIKWAFELVDTNEQFGEGKPLQPFHLSMKKFTKSLSGVKNNMRNTMEALMGRKMQPGETVKMESFLNFPCQVQVIHDQGKDGKSYANINLVLPAQNPAMVAPLRNAPIFFDLDSPTCVTEYPKINGRKLLEEIHSSPEFKALVASGRIQQRVIEPKPGAPAAPAQNFQAPQQPTQNWQPPAQPWAQQANQFQQQPQQPIQQPQAGQWGAPPANPTPVQFQQQPAQQAWGAPAPQGPPAGHIVNPAFPNAIGAPQFIPAPSPEAPPF